MQQLSFHAPETLGDACELLDQFGEDARVLAGGQSLIQMLKQRIVDAEHVVDISGIDELSGTTVDDDVLWIGATVTYADVLASPVVAETVPVLPEMAGTIGDTQVRNRGTLVGGIAHADPDGDPPVLATAMDATIRLRSTRGERTVTGSDFYEGFYETVRKPDEIVTAVGFPAGDDRTGAAYEAFAPRAGDYAVASVAFVATIEEAVITDASVVVGSVSDKPVELTAVGEAIVGEAPTDETVTLGAETAADHVTPFDGPEFSAAYKTRLVERLVRAAAPRAFDAAGD